MHQERSLDRVEGVKQFQQLVSVRRSSGGEFHANQIKAKFGAGFTFHQIRWRIVFTAQVQYGLYPLIAIGAQTAFMRVIGPEDAIVHDPLLTRKLDCETELAIVIGKAGRHIPTDHALEHVFGYTIANDVTARDRQVRFSENGTVFYELGRGKAFDTSLPLGPVITTADEIPDPQTLKLSTRINGELRQNANTADMIWTCADLIHVFSVNFTLQPGMVILTGTPAGTAWSVDKELGGTWQPTDGLVAATRYCLPGDIVESEIEGIGLLRNPVTGARAPTAA